MVGFAHGYDRMNNPLLEDKLHDEANSQAYDYDSAYRLTGFQRPAPEAQAPVHGQWALDGVGNWQQVDGETRRHSSFNEIVEIDRGGELTQVLSDDSGNEVDNGSYLLQWDYRNRLRVATRESDGAPVAGCTPTTLWAGAPARSRSPDAAPETTSYYYDGWQVIEEQDESQVLLQQYVYGRYIDGALVLDRNLDGDGDATGGGDQRLYYHQNGLYSTFALTDTSGTIVEAYQYDAYGGQTVFRPGDGPVSFGPGDIVDRGGASSVGNPYLFTGRRLDPETGLYFFRARYMDPVQGRFISRDPIGLGPNLARAGTLYTYVASRPTYSVDPFGLLGAGEVVAGVAQGAKKAAGSTVQATPVQSILGQLASEKGAKGLGGATKIVQNCGRLKAELERENGRRPSSPRTPTPTPTPEVSDDPPQPTLDERINTLEHRIERANTIWRNRIKRDAPRIRSRMQTRNTGTPSTSWRSC